MKERAKVTNIARVPGFHISPPRFDGEKPNQIWRANREQISSKLQPGEPTAHSRVPKAYRIASVQVAVGQDTARLQVIDYVGEEPLEGGRHTYVLSFFEGNPESLILELEEGS